MPDRFRRPPTPAGFDPSRAAERGHDPYGWAYESERLQAVYDVIGERRDVRRFRPDPVPDAVVTRILGAGHQAPSVGLMQPWRFIVIREPRTRSAIRGLAQRERLRQAERFDARARHFLDQKIEGVIEAPLGICVCCDHGSGREEILGRGTIPETDIYSASCAIENLWLAARAEGLGIGWVSFYRPDDLAALLGLPDNVEPLAYLCVGWPDERPVRPTLETVGWGKRLPLEAVVMEERWREPVDPAHPPGAESGAGHEGVIDSGTTVDRAAAIAARDRLDQLVKPAGSLGALEGVIERWAQVTGAPPPERLRAGVLVCAADHGHVARRTSLFGGEVSSQVAAAAARGESAVAVLAAAGGHELIIADVGLAGATPEGLHDCKVGAGTADFCAGPAMTAEQTAAAMRTGAELAVELAGNGAGCLVLGEIGIGNTTTAAALACALLGIPPEQAVGRGTGLDAAGLERKRAVVAAALACHAEARATDPASPAGDPAADPITTLTAVGGFEFAALSGVILKAVELRLPVLLDGFAVTVSGLIAAAIDPLARELLFATHRSAEPAHERLLNELGLEPLLDLRLRLGEASGALLAVPLIEAAGTLHRQMGTFEESGVSQAH